MKRKTGFTLAEVLITLGIIGVVAAMTLPALTASYRKSTTETALKKFYTNVNQAVKLSVVNNGETKYWKIPGSSQPDSIMLFYDKYFKDYLKTLKVEKDINKINVYFADGSGVGIMGSDWIYCIKAKDLQDIDVEFPEPNELVGTKCFAFGLYPRGACIEGTFSYNNFYNKGVEPYVVCMSRNSDGEIDESSQFTTEADLAGNAYHATKLIQMNGWRIPDDYPFIK